MVQRALKNVVIITKYYKSEKGNMILSAYLEIVIFVLNSPLDCLKGKIIEAKTKESGLVRSPRKAVAFLTFSPFFLIRIFRRLRTAMGALPLNPAALKGGRTSLYTPAVESSFCSVSSLVFNPFITILGSSMSIIRHLLPFITLVLILSVASFFMFIVISGI